MDSWRVKSKARADPISIWFGLCMFTCTTNQSGEFFNPIGSIRYVSFEHADPVPRIAGADVVAGRGPSKGVRYGLTPRGQRPRRSGRWLGTTGQAWAIISFGLARFEGFCPIGTVNSASEMPSLLGPGAAFGLLYVPVRRHWSPLEVLSICKVKDAG